MPMKIKGFLKYYIIDRVVLFQKGIQLILWSKKPPILIFTMAKVGSLSIYFSLKKSVPRTTLFHIHDLNENDISKNIKLCLDNGIYPGSRSPIPLILSEVINAKRPYKIISLFRDPIERNISAFFDAFELYVGMPSEKYTGTLAELEAIYHEKLPHNYAINWFDEHLRSTTGIDIYQQPFNREEGVMNYTNGNVSVLIMNSATDDDVKAKFISNFADAKKMVIRNRNITAKSGAAELYSSFKNTIKFEKEYLDKMYQSKYAKHLFTKSYLAEAMNKWSKV
jgi:hypothetical protein